MRIFVFLTIMLTFEAVDANIKKENKVPNVTFISQQRCGSQYYCLEVIIMKKQAVIDGDATSYFHEIESDYSIKGIHGYFLLPYFYVNRGTLHFTFNIYTDNQLYYCYYLVRKEEMKTSVNISRSSKCSKLYSDIPLGNSEDYRKLYWKTQKKHLECIVFCTRTYKESSNFYKCFGWNTFKTTSDNSPAYSTSKNISHLAQLHLPDQKYEIISKISIKSKRTIHFAANFTVGKINPLYYSAEKNYYPVGLSGSHLACEEKLYVQKSSENTNEEAEFVDKDYYSKIDYKRENKKLIFYLNSKDLSYHQISHGYNIKRNVRVSESSERDNKIITITHSDEITYNLEFYIFLRYKFNGFMVLWKYIVKDKSLTDDAKPIKYIEKLFITDVFPRAEHTGDKWEFYKLELISTEKMNGNISSMIFSIVLDIKDITFEFSACSQLASTNYHASTIMENVYRFILTINFMGEYLFDSVFCKLIVLKVSNNDKNFNLHIAADVKCNTNENCTIISLKKTDVTVHEADKNRILIERTNMIKYHNDEVVKAHNKIVEEIRKKQEKEQLEKERILNITREKEKREKERNATIERERQKNETLKREIMERQKNETRERERQINETLKRQIMEREINETRERERIEKEKNATREKLKREREINETLEREKREKEQQELEKQRQIEKKKEEQAQIEKERLIKQEQEEREAKEAAQRAEEEQKQRDQEAKIKKEKEDKERKEKQEKEKQEKEKQEKEKQEKEKQEVLRKIEEEKNKIKNIISNNTKNNSEENVAKSKEDKHKAQAKAFGNVEHILKNVKKNITEDNLQIYYFVQSSSKFSLIIKSTVSANKNSKNASSNTQNIEEKSNQSSKNAPNDTDKPSTNVEISGEGLNKQENLTVAYYEAPKENTDIISGILVITHADSEKQTNNTSNSEVTKMTKKPIVMKFTVLNPNIPGSFNCVWTKENQSEFKSEGCNRSYGNNTDPKYKDVICTCDHLTSFAVMFGADPRDAESAAMKNADFMLSNLTYLTTSVSILFLLALLKQNVMEKKKTLKSKEVSALSVVYIFIYASFIISSRLSNEAILCTVMKFVCGYSQQVLYITIALYGYRVYKNLVNVQLQKNWIMKDTGFILPWALPVVWLIPAIVIAKDDENESCFLNRDRYFTTILPVFVLVIFTNFILLSRIYQKTLGKKCASMSKEKRKSSIKLLVYLSLTLGVCWALQFLAVTHKMFEFLFVIVNGSQGSLLYYNMNHTKSQRYRRKKIVFTQFGGRSSILTSMSSLTDERS